MIDDDLDDFEEDENPPEVFSPDELLLEYTDCTNLINKARVMLRKIKYSHLFLAELKANQSTDKFKKQQGSAGFRNTSKIVATT